MPTRVSDLWHYDEPIPEAWEDMLKEIERAGANRNHVEAIKLRMQVALLSSQASVDLHIEDQTERRAQRSEVAAAAFSEAQRAQADASNAQAQSANAIAKSLTRATWVLAGATVALIIATLVGAIIAASAS